MTYKLWTRCLKKNAFIQQAVPVLWWCTNVGWLTYPCLMCCLSVALINVCRCLCRQTTALEWALLWHPAVHRAVGSKQYCQVSEQLFKESM